MELADDGNAKSKSEDSNGEGHQRLVTSSPTPEYIPHTLKLEMVRRGRLPLEDCIQIGLSLMTALEHLHSHGLVHRDVKPSNIIFIKGVPKLADIGLVSSFDATMSFVGTAGYFPPEGPGKPTGDIYSLGKVLYELSVGRNRGDFPALPQDWKEFADQKGFLEFNAVILKACEFKPYDRYQAASEMSAELKLVLEGGSVRRKRKLELRLTSVAKVFGVATLALGFMFFTRLPRGKPLDPLTTGKNVGGYPPTVMRGTRNLQAWNHYKLAEAALESPGIRDGLSAEYELKEAMRLDPKFALPYWGLFRVRFGDTWGMTHIGHTNEFLEMAAKMCRLDKDLAETHVLAGLIKFWEWNWIEAEREYSEALKLNPDCMPARVCYGFLLSHTGRAEESIDVLRKGEKVDPTHPQIVKMIGHAYFAKRDFRTALKYYQRSSQIAPKFGEGHLRAYYALLGLRDFQGALREHEMWEMRHGDVDPNEVKQGSSLLSVEWNSELSGNEVEYGD